MNGSIKPSLVFRIKRANNNEMKTFIETLVLALMVMMSQLAFAQSEDKTLLRTEQMAARLGLDENQKAQLDKQLKAAQEERQDRMEKLRAMREEMKRDAFVERQKEREALESILTPEQLEKLKTMKAKRGEQMKQRMQNRRGDGRFDRERMMQFRQNRQQMIKKRTERLKEQKKGDGGN